MRRLSIKLDVPKLKLAPQLAATFTEDKFPIVFENFFNSLLGLKGGLTRQQQKIHARIGDKLDADGQSGFIILEESEFDFIKEIFFDENIRINADQSRMMSQYVKHIEAAKDAPALELVNGCCKGKDTGEAASCS